MKAGTYIGSTALLDDTVFEQAVILITEHNEKGAMGFVINKLFSRRFNELEAFKHSVPFPLYEGGPVDKEHLFFVHQRPDLIKGGTLITGSLYMGGDFQQAVQCLNEKKLTEKDIKLFIGYCGWDHGELEAEVKEGSWTLLPNTAVLL